MSDISGLSAVNISYNKKKEHILKDISFDLKTDSKVALVGLNGAGKSTLLRLLAGDLLPEEGKISYLPDSKKLQPHNLTFKAISGYMMSGMTALDGLRVGDYLTLVAGSKGMTNEAISESIELIAGNWDITHLLDKSLSELSQGNMQKVSIVQSLINQPEFLILDEPTQALDPLEQQRFVDQISQLKIPLCIFSSHHINETVILADTVVMLHQGELVAKVEINNKGEFWLLTYLQDQVLKEKIETINSRIEWKEQGKIENYGRTIRIISIENISLDSWNKIIKGLAKEEEIKCLGQGKDVLMPIFRCLSGESL
ncbi:MAG: ABC transporter ATP-binding protein [Gammaproteobacteria bacterium]|nr:ABC transporter ATP-binding protein [Gammaproteobacteria bacterium]